MKRFLFFSLAISLIGGMILFNSCGKDNKDDKEEVKLSYSTTNVDDDGALLLEFSSWFGSPVRDTFAVTATPSKDLEWTSSNEEVASVTVYGQVITQGIGEATITATHTPSGKSASIKVRVVTSVESYELTKYEFTNVYWYEDEDAMHLQDRVGDSLYTVSIEGYGDLKAHIREVGFLVCSGDNEQQKGLSRAWILLKYRALFFGTEENADNTAFLSRYKEGAWYARLGRVDIRERSGDADIFVAQPGKFKPFEGFKTSLQLHLDSFIANFYFPDSVKEPTGTALTDAYFDKLGRRVEYFQDSTFVTIARWSTNKSRYDVMVNANAGIVKRGYIELELDTVAKVYVIPSYDITVQYLDYGEFVSYPGCTYDGNLQITNSDYVLTDEIRYQGGSASATAMPARKEGDNKMRLIDASKIKKLNKEDLKKMMGVDENLMRATYKVRR